jgi:hypothetical protein
MVALSLQTEGVVEGSDGVDLAQGYAQPFAHQDQGISREVVVPLLDLSQNRNQRTLCSPFMAIQDIVDYLY